MVCRNPGEAERDARMRGGILGRPRTDLGGKAHQAFRASSAFVPPPTASRVPHPRPRPKPRKHSAKDFSEFRKALE